MTQIARPQTGLRNLGFISAASLQELEQGGYIDLTGWYGAVIHSAGLYLARRMGTDALVRSAPDRSDLDRETIIGYGTLEAQGATVIRAIGRSVLDVSLRADLLSHARDEARHARLYFHCLRQPLTKAERSRVSSNVRGSATEFQRIYQGDILQFIASTHIAELRTFEALSRASKNFSSLSFDEQVDRQSYRKLLDLILEDEIRHIAYTWRLLNASRKRDELPNQLLTAICEYGLDS